MSCTALLGLQGNACSSAWSTSSPPYTDFGVPAALSHFSPFSPICICIVYPCLNALSLRCHNLGCWAQQCPAVRPLEMARTSCVWLWAALAAPHRSCPCSTTTPTTHNPNTWTMTLYKCSVKTCNSSSYSSNIRDHMGKSSLGAFPA